jgi:hypothetical protein
MNRFVPMAALLACTIALPASATCYTVVGSKGRVIYQSTQAPIDMSRQIHETLPARFPDGHLVFSLRDTSCPEILPLQLSSAPVPNGITRSRSAARSSSGGEAPINLDHFFNDSIYERKTY